MASENACIVCLSNCVDVINIFCKQNGNQQISTIITTHFWFKINSEEEHQVICTKCWSSIETFHEFYKQIEGIHFDEKVDFNEADLKIKLEPSTTSSNENNDDQPELTATDSADIKSEESDGDGNVEQFFANCDDNYEESDSSETSTVKSIKKKRSIVSKKIKIKNANQLEKEAKRILREQQNSKIVEFFKLDCEKCNQKCTSYYELQVHYKKIHGIARGYIGCCGKRLYSRAAVLEHIHWHENPDDFTCSLCNKTYTEQNRYRAHMETHLPEHAIYKCDSCSKEYLRKKSLLQHILLVHVSHEKRHMCTECGKGFRLNSILKGHIRRVHEHAYRHVCDICAKVYNNKQQYKEHRKQHTGEVTPKMQCSQCGAWLKNVHSLRCHIIRSHNQSPESCSYCGKISPNKSALRNHIRNVHISQPIFKCTLCDKAFKKQLSLKEHMASHTGDILYTCTYCPKTFNSNANKHSHRKKAHPEEWIRDRTVYGPKSIKKVYKE